MPPKKSPVWKYIVKDSSKEGHCKICGVRVCTSGNTSNAWAHLAQHGVNKQNAVDAGSRQQVASTTNTSVPSVSGRRRPHEGSDDPDNDNFEDVEYQRSSTAEAPVSEQAHGSSSDVVLPTMSKVLPKRPRSGEGGARASVSISNTGRQSTIEGCLKRATSFNKDGGSRDAELRDALLFMEMRQNLSLSFSDGEGFKHFAAKAIPLWSPPSRRTITRLMEEKYEVVAALVRDELSKLDSVCLTADCWTDSHTTQSFLGVTVHFVVIGEMKSACIGLLKLDQSHTAGYLSGKLLEFCQEWSIDPLKVEAVVVDNAANIKLAVRLAFGEAKLVNCFAHTLNLIPKVALGYKTSITPQPAAAPGARPAAPGGRQADPASGAQPADPATRWVPVVDGVPQLVKKVKGIVTLLHSSINFADEIKRVQIQQYNKTAGTALRLIRDIVTRWGSTFEMIKRFLDMQPVLLLAASGFPEVNMLTASELATLKCIMALLEPIHEATTEMSAETSTTISKVIPLASNISKAIEKVSIPQGDTMAHRFKQFILAEFLSRFGSAEHNTRQAASTIVDPRFLEIYFQSAVAVSKARKFIENAIVQEIVLDSVDVRGNGDAPPQPQPSEPSSSGSGSKLWSSHAELAASRTSANTDDVTGRAVAEMRGFLQRNVVDMHVDPLKLWEQLRPMYPHLYKVARKMLAVLATSVPAERFFSMTGDIMDAKGRRLTPEHLAIRVFLRSVGSDLWEAARLKKVTI